MTPIETATVDAALLLPPLTNGAEPPALVTAVPATSKRPPVRRHSVAVREAVRLDVETTTLLITEIARKHGVGTTTVSAWIRKYDWSRPPGAPPLRIAGGGKDKTGQRARLMARLYRTFGRQLATLEKRAADAGGESIEKDARTLGVLAKTLETLMQLDRDDGAKVREPEPVDSGHLRLELARKIAAWAEEEEEPGTPDPAVDRPGGRVLGEGLE